MEYRRAGRSGLQLPVVSLGAWANLGDTDAADLARTCILTAFDRGITHFDFANNYGDPPGNAEIVGGRILGELPRDEVVIASKAGYPMWPGPYGDGGSRKHLVASCDQSLRRLGLDYLDVFYSHRPDPATPIEETIGALATLVHQGKVLYAGLSSYRGEVFDAAVDAAAAVGLPITLAQPYYNMLGRAVETELIPGARRSGTGIVAFCPLASGLLTDRYLDGEVPQGSRAAIWPGRWVRAHSPSERAGILQGLNRIAARRGQSLAEMALSWTLRLPELTAVVLGASRPEQIERNLRFLDGPPLDDTDLADIDALVGGPDAGFTP